MRLARKVRRVARCAGTLAGLAAAVPAAAEEAVPLSVAPGTDLQMTFTATNVLWGSDTDGPNTVAVTGSALVELGTTVDPTHGLVASSLRFVESDLAFADTDFTIDFRFTLNYAFQGIAGELGPETLGPGTAIAAGLSELDQGPLVLSWTDGATTVDFTGESIPVDGMTFDLTGAAQVSTLANGDVVDVVVTLPVAASALRTYPYYESDETTLSGDLVLVGSYPLSPVPALGGAALPLLALAVLGVGMAIRRC